MMATTLRHAAQALLDKLDGRRSFGVQLLAAEFADERRALRAALATPDRALPAGDAALPVVAGNDHEVNVLRELQAIANDKDGGFWPTMVAIGALGIIGRQQANYAALERCATGLQADLVEERNRIGGMRVEWAAEVAALTAQARHAEDCTEAAKARIAELEHGWKERACTDVEVLMAAYHSEVWEAASDEGMQIAYDLAGEETARRIVAAVTARDMRIADLQAEGAKSERRAIEFGDIVHRHVLVMRAAVVEQHHNGADEAMTWIANTLAGPGHLPSGEDIDLGAQALFDKEVAEQEAFRAAHPGTATPAPRDTAAMLAEHMQLVTEVGAAGWACNSARLRAAELAAEASARKLIGEA